MLFTPPPTGSLVLLASQTAAAVAVVDFAASIDGTYDEYELHIVNAVPATNSVTAYLRTSANGGTSFDAVATDYYTDGVNAAQIAISSGVISNLAASGGLCGVVRMFDPAGTTHKKRFDVRNSWLQAAAAPSNVAAAATRDSVAAVNAIRFLFSAGNIASGKFKLYGVQK